MGNEKNNSIVEDTLLQIKAVQEAISENAKGILASTMKEEISELIKESLGDSNKSKSPLKEQEEDDIENVDDMDDVEVDTDVDMEDEMGDEELDFDTEEGDDEMDAEMDFSMDDMGMEDEDEMEPLDLTGASAEEILKVFKAMGDEDGIIIKKENDFIELKDEDTDTEYLIQTENEDKELNTDEEEMDEEYEMDEDVVYELEMDEEAEEEMDEEYEMDEEAEEEMDEESEVVYEIEMDDEESEEEMDESIKPKGINMGKPKFSYEKQKGGFKENLKQGNVKMGTGKPKFEFKEGEEEENEWKEETTEGSRTMTYKRRATRDRVAAPSQLRKESFEKELNLLREKNEEYKKALDFFRNKLNEVAIFNSNLAYSTRLFTEHSTTKQEKINILRRFDNVDSIKESKNLYKAIKEELDTKTGTSEVVTESIQREVVKTPQNGSATNLIESKTYENPQFMRMRDLMSKINK